MEVLKKAGYHNGIIEAGAKALRELNSNFGVVTGALIPVKGALTEVFADPSRSLRREIQTRPFAEEEVTPSVHVDPANWTGVGFTGFTPPKVILTPVAEVAKKIRALHLGAR